MKKEDINVSSTHISLNYGDYIIDSSGTTEQVAYVDYVAKMVIAIPIDCEPVVGDLSSCSRTSIITFDDIVSDYQKVLKDTDAIKTTNGDISIKTGDAVINNGRLLQVIDVAYDSGLVDISEYGDEYTISLADIDSVDYIDSVTQVVTTNPRKNRLIIIANGLNSHSSVKEVKDNNSPRIGDEITGAEGNKYVVVCIDYNDCEVTVSSADGEEFSFNLDGFDSSVYKKVLK